MNRRDTTTLQKRLRAAGLITLKVDGDYGSSTRRHVLAFQQSHARWRKPLPETGSCKRGDRTWWAILQASRTAKVSKHFYYSELRCHDPRNPTLFEGERGVQRELIVHLERLRTLNGRPLHVISGFRTESHNRAVRGESNSRHLYGDAVDISRYDGVTVAEAVRAGFDGIGDDNDMVMHVDMRGYPSRWEY